MPTRIDRRLARALAHCLDASPAWHALLAVLVLVIGYLALAPQPPEELSTGWDLMNHALAFAALAFVASIGHRQSAARWAAALLAVLAYGALIEVVQLYVPGRIGEWADLMADLVGIVIGTTAAALVLRAVRAIAAVPR
jgi:VanZ family protein